MDDVMGVCVGYIYVHGRCDGGGLYGERWVLV